MMEASERTPAEGRADVTALEELHQARLDLLEELAPLMAMHGPYGLFDPKRKALVEAMKVRARLHLSETGGKITDAIVDADAHCDPEYVAWLDRQMSDRVEYIKMAAKLDEINEMIRNRDLMLQIYNAEVRLGH